MSPARPRSSRWKLKPLHLAGLPPLVEVKAVLTIGRDASNDLRLSEDLPQVSGHHARVEPEGRELWLVDLGSTNGTLVNGSRVTRCRLSSGDTIQLGGGGPRFVALDAAAIRAQVGSGDDGSLGATKIVRAGAALEPPSIAANRRAGRAGSERDAGEGEPGGASPLAVSKTLWIAVFLFTLVSMAAAAGLVYLERKGAAEQARLQGVSSQIERRLAQQLVDADHRFLEQARFWDRQRAGLEAERDSLLAQIGTFESTGLKSQKELGDLREQLAATKKHLEMFDPVGLEQKRLADVARVRRSVVLIEKKVVYRDAASGKLLHFDRGEQRDDALNLEGRGEPLTLDASTGSGFCIDGGGWIVTNAHVLDFSSSSFPIRFAEGVELKPERSLDVVFTDTAERRPATVVHVAAGEHQDMALLRIEPFEGMPAVPSLDLDLEPPAPGSEVYLFGFPLGHHALQMGDTVVASTFKGILSRRVDPFLQVDAGVYPGNSGGPLADAKGRVIGIIFSVQNNLDGTTAANIGYAIPISELRVVWPPPEPDSSALAKEASAARAAPANAVKTAE